MAQHVQKTTWLRGVLNGGEQTQPHHGLAHSPARNEPSIDDLVRKIKQSAAHVLRLECEEARRASALQEVEDELSTAKEEHATLVREADAEYMRVTLRK